MDVGHDNRSRYFSSHKQVAQALDAGLDTAEALARGSGADS